MLWRIVLTALLVTGGYLSYNYTITKENTAHVSLTMHVAAPRPSVIENPTHWNLKSNIQVNLATPAKIRSYHIKTTTNNHLVVYEKDQIVLDEPTSLSFELPKPTIQLGDQTLLRYEIQVRDWSYANFFNGNTSTKVFDLVLDTTPPKIQTIAQSRRITYGGSALVVFKVQEDALDRVWFNNGFEDFKVFSFMKDGYYIVIFPWSLLHRTFDGEIFARDKAYNLTSLPLRLIKNTKVSIRAYTTDLSKDYKSKQAALESLKHLPALNRLDARLGIQQTIQEDLKKVLAYEPIALNPFRPLGNKPRILATFGTRKIYTFGKERVGEFTHYGVDFFGRHSKIVASNLGRVVLEEEIESYGKSVLISHGLGVYAMYGSLSDFLVNKGDTLEPNSVLGYSGKNRTSKYDHVHFNILIQGVPVYPNEWMDAHFINSLNDTIQEAQQKIQEK
ncbi:M23 family metallopeptidase [Helicobacter heilmannii]|uniref:M23 family metallopeptidase n=1 Tax=Helicobacter heilmannii TaxID=35817 RepID=UPI0006A2283E|nr:M23 family metallopeptidase [Helicobacter heilmannii]CRF45535.1 Putative periplasmic protein [Helicobacter heilmannii]CRF48345.1 Putative periplasmic protein [Helicobacter heilmannii]CRF48937.1 Putative periplasmic protein [Helicobacter heilmannii]CRF51269.1 Putative periplasmic protein [Helicobacter heilmannii]